MRLKRIRLEHWRGVASREIEFGDGVTLIEGPNETGKSSLVEALLTLIRELDSSGKQSIKAIQPVGQDVGSTVEAEIEAGDWRFTYSKTYNRDKQTTLDITAPQTAQLTGREAHERVEQILNETVDLALWEALLVDQGEKIAPADIKDSAGLSRALDEAAGAGSVGEEDTDLFDAVQAEYERYYTLRAGKPKFEAEEKAVGAARERADAARAALMEVEQYAERQERLQADVRSREKQLPGLRQSAEELETRWREIDAVRGAVKLREQELEAAIKVLAEAERAAEERAALARSIRDAEATIRDRETALAPGRSAIEAIRKKLDSAALVLANLQAKRRAARDSIALAQADARHLRRAAELEALNGVLRELAGISTEIEQSAATVAKTAVDKAGLEVIRDAQNELRVLEGRRDLAATSVSVRAEQDLVLELGDESITLGESGSLERPLASATRLRLPGVASIDIEPPKAAADLASRVADADAALAQLYKEYAVRDADDAAVQLARKEAAQSNLELARRREQSLLDGRSRVELEQRGRQLARDVDTYLQERSSDTPIPVDVASAETLLETMQDEANAIEQKVGAAEAGSQSLQQDLDEAQGGIRAVENELIGLRATCDANRERLAMQQSQQDDAALKKSLEDADAAKSAATSAFDDAKAALDKLNPDRIELLCDNAKRAQQRAESEFNQLRTELAVMDDRMDQSRANGRFEQFEQAERELDDAEDRLATVRRRAEAAKHLYETVSRHRTAARQAYVQPLRDAIERLGRIVFSDDFSVAISEDWSIESRTLDNKTLPFDALSIGAQEQLGILTRLAAAQIVSTQGGVPLIIDDALGFSDPERLQTMGAAIAEAGKDCQAIILTCSPGRFTHVGNAEVVSI